MNIFAIGPFIVSWLTLFFGIFVYFKNRKAKLNKVFSLICLSVFIWAFGYSQMYNTKSDDATALFWVRFGYAGAVFIPVFVWHYIMIFLDIKFRKWVMFGLYLLSLLFFLVSRTPVFLYSMHNSYFWGYYPKAGSIYIFFVLFFALVFISAVTVLYYHLKLKKEGLLPNEVNRIKYLLAGFAIASTSLVDYLPNYGIEIYPWGYLSAFGWLVCMWWATFKYRLMDINIAITRAGIFIFVYALVLGIPFGLAGLGREVLMSIWGQNWFWAPMIILLGLATAGPFIYQYLRKQVDAIMLKEQKRYQQAIANLTKKIAEIRDLDKLLDEETSTITKEVKASFCAMYLNSEEYKSFRLKSCYPAQAKARFPEFVVYDDSLVASLIAQDKPLLSEEAGKRGKFLLDPGGLIIPCFGKDGLLSIIILGAKTDNQIYGETDILAFKNLSYATSLAIESCTYWKELEERQRQARMAEMDLFSYSVAHEIDNPMAIIKGNGEYLRRHFFKEVSLNQEQQKEAEEVVTAILEAQTRVSGMVKAIEEFGKKVPSEMAVFKFSEVLEHYFNLYAPILKSHHIQLAKDVPGDLPYVRGRLQELMQVLAIFSQNTIHALKYAPEKRILFKVETVNSDWVRVSFSDTGYGIEKEKLSAIFSAFVTTKASSEGTGMGLYNAKRFILRHQGKIWAESEGKDKGSTLIFEIPIVKDATEGEIRKAREDKGGRKF